MKQFSLVLIAALLTSCAGFEPTVRAYTTVQTAPHALELLNGYVTAPKYQKRLAGDVAALQELYEAVKDAEQGQSIVNFIIENPQSIPQASQHWADLVDTVEDYQGTVKKQIPAELIAYRADVEASWIELLDAMERLDRAYKVKHYGAILLKILAARNGVILR